MDKLNEEILRQLLLMNFDRSKTLYEQDEKNFKIDPRLTQQKSDRLGPQGDFQPKIKPKTPDALKTDNEVYQEDKQVAISAYNKIVEEIDGGWAPWKWGTDEDGMTNAILSIKNKQQYQILLHFLRDKYEDFDTNKTILSFIQEKEFSVGEDDFMSSLYKDSPYLSPMFGQRYQWDTNDYYLKRMENHLQKFNKDERYSRVGAMDRTGISLLLPPAASAAAHTILPVLSWVTSFFPPASIMFELVDAGLYLEEGDPYSAGLGFLFAFIPAGQFAMVSRTFSKSEKLALMKKVQKDAAGESFEKYTEKEAKLLATLGEEGVQKMIKKEIAKRAIIETLDEMASIRDTWKIVWWLVKKGYMPIKTLTQMGITIGGTFYTWDFIASVLKVCNSMGMKQLTEEDKWYLQLIGGTAKFLQQFSTDCEKERALLDFHNSVTSVQESTKNLVIKRLKNIIESNINLTLKGFKSTKSLETMSVQLALRNLGFTKYTEITKSYTDIKIYEPVKDEFEGLSKYEIQQLNQTPTYDPTGGVGQARMSSQLPATGNWKSDQEMTAKMMKLPKEEKKVVDVKFKWGYYDDNTSMVIKEFQKKNNLKVDGECGVNTAKKLIEKINSLSKLDPYDSGIDDLTKEQILKIESEIVKKFELENKSKLSEEDLNEKPTTSQINELEEDLNENMTNQVENMDPNEWNTKIIIDEYDNNPPE